MSGEQKLLHPYLLKDVLEDAIKQMEIVLQKYNANIDATYYMGYKHGIEFSKEKVDEMWEEFKARLWSDMKDEDDMARAIEEYEMQK